MRGEKYCLILQQLLYHIAYNTNLFYNDNNHQNFALHWLNLQCMAGFKHFLEHACSKRSVLKCTQPNLWPHTMTAIIFLSAICTYVDEIYPLVPTVNFCTSPTDNIKTNKSTTLSILKLGTLRGNQHFHWLWGLVRSWPFAGTHRFLAGLFNS